MPITERKSTPNAIASLKADHKKVKALFKKFESAKDRRVKKTIGAEVLEELGIHAMRPSRIRKASWRRPMKNIMWQRS